MVVSEDKTDIKPTKQNQMISPKTKEWLLNLDDQVMSEFNQFYIESSDLELIQEECIDWMCYEDEEFKARWEALNEELDDDDEDIEREEALEELKQELHAVVGWTSPQEWMSDEQKLLVKSNGHNRGNREWWRFCDEQVQEFLEMQGACDELLDATIGLPDSISDWTDEHRKIEDTRLTLLKDLTTYLFAFSDWGYAHTDGYLERDPVQSKRLEAIKEVVKAN